MSANRWIGVSAPVESQPNRPVTGSGVALSWPRCACAAARLRGEVFVSRAYPYCARLVTGTGGLRFGGSSEKAWPGDGEFGSRAGAGRPVELKTPAKGAGMPPKLSHGVLVDSVSSAPLAESAVTGVRLLPPSM